MVLFYLFLFVVANPVTFLIALNLVFGDSCEVPSEVTEEESNACTDTFTKIELVRQFVQYLCLGSFLVSLASYMMTGELHAFNESLALLVFGNFMYASDIYWDNYSSSMLMRYLETEIKNEPPASGSD